MLETGVGEWWMLYDDFTKCFTSLTICHPEPEPMEEGSRVIWEETAFKVQAHYHFHPSKRNTRETGTRRVGAQGPLAGRQAF